MSRVGCPEEVSQQQPHSPGVIGDHEPIVFVVPLDTEIVSLKIFEKGKLIRKELSISRSSHCQYDEMYQKVVATQLHGNDGRKYQGYFWALCAELRSILTIAQPSKKGPTAPPIGAFCVIDAGEPDYAAHGVMGFTNPGGDFWQKNNRDAARGSLLVTFQKRGLLLQESKPPFR